LARNLHTQLGKIGRALSALDIGRTSLQREVTDVVRLLAVLGLSACVLVAVANILRRHGMDLPPTLGNAGKNSALTSKDAAHGNQIARGESGMGCIRGALPACFAMLKPEIRQKILSWRKFIAGETDPVVCESFAGTTRICSGEGP
jgi:hypothetical protein